MNPQPSVQSHLNKARLDKFLLVLTIPPALRDIVANSIRTKNTINENSLQFSIYGSPVPAISVPAIDLPYAGQTVKVSSHTRPAYPPLVVNFGVDNLYTNWWVLWKWLDILNGAKNSIWNPPTPPSKTNPIVGTAAEYATTVTIFGKSEFNKNVIQFNYYGAFITDLSEMGFNYRVTDEISSTFTFQYSRFDAVLLDL